VPIRKSSGTNPCDAFTLEFTNNGCAVGVSFDSASIGKALLISAVGLYSSGCTVITVAGGVVGAGVAVATTAVNVGVAVGSTAVGATTTVVKAAVPGD
jgi:hypothetical protein